jgi:hypothetical protein
VAFSVAKPNSSSASASDSVKNDRNCLEIGLNNWRTGAGTGIEKMQKAKTKAAGTSALHEALTQESPKSKGPLPPQRFMLDSATVTRILLKLEGNQAELDNEPIGPFQNRISDPHSHLSTARSRLALSLMLDDQL